MNSKKKLSVLSVLSLALFTAGCPRPGVGPNTPPAVVDPATAFPCGTFTSIPLHCTSDLGEKDYKFDVLSYCDAEGHPEMLYTAQSADTPAEFQLGATCSINTDTWALNADDTEATVDCTDHWGDGSSTHYTFALSFTANTGAIHGELHFHDVYMDATTTYTPGYSDCTF